MANNEENTIPISSTYYLTNNIIRNNGSYLHRSLNQNSIHALGNNKHHFTTLSLDNSKERLSREKRAPNTILSDRRWIFSVYMERYKLERRITTSVVQYRMKWKVDRSKPKKCMYVFIYIYIYIYIYTYRNKKLIISIS